LLKTPDVFSSRLKSAFGVSIDPRAIYLENSGVEDFLTLSLNEVGRGINRHLQEIGTYYTRADDVRKNIIRQFSKYTSLAYTDAPLLDNNTGFQIKV
jgi:hypothetical protein